MTDADAPKSKATTSTKRPVPPTPSRRRRWLKRLAVLAVVAVGVLLIASMGEREWSRVRGEGELAQALSTADGTDPDWTWDRLNASRKRPPAGKNAAELIPRIKGHIHPDWGKTLHAEGKWLPRVSMVPPNARFGPTVIADLRRDLATSADAVKLARTLKDHPFGHRDIVLTADGLDKAFPEVHWTRNALDVLRWDGIVASEDGDLQRVADDLLAMVGTCRAIGDEPSYISQLVRGGNGGFTVLETERTLAHHATIPDLALLQAALATEAEEPLLLVALRGERAQAHELFGALRAGKTDIFAQVGRIPGDWERFWWQFKYRGDRAADHARAISYFTQYVEVARLPLESQVRAIERLPTATRDPNRIMSSMILTKPEHFLAYVRGAALLRCAVVGIACERFRQQHKRWPDSLAELVPAFLPVVPLDPFTGQPLRYAVSDSGAVVFSPGRGGAEDGGTHDEVHPPATMRVRFRLWNPELRRQPAPPEPLEPEIEP